MWQPRPPARQGASPKQQRVSSSPEELFGQDFVTVTPAAACRVALHSSPPSPPPHLITAYAPHAAILAATMSSERGARGGPTRARGRGTNPFRGTSRGGGSNGAPTQPAAQNTWTRGQRGGRGTAPRGTINSNVRGRGNKS
jgi:hypothetical protein